MRGTSIKALVGELSESVPGTSIAAAGFGLALYAYEARRMSSFGIVGAGSLEAVVPSLASIVALIILVFAYGRRPRFRLHRHPWVGFTIAGVVTLIIFLLGGSLALSSPAINVLARIVRSVGELLLLLCWTEVLITLAPRKFGTLIAL